MQFTAVHIAELSALGLLAGLLGGLLGIGGGAIFVPGMRILGVAQHLAQAAAMVTEFFVAAPASLRHALEKVVVPQVVRFLIPGAIVGVLIGVAASNLPVFRGAGSTYLARLFAGFLVYVMVYNVYRLIRFRQRLPAVTAEAAGRLPRWRSTAIGLGMGFAAGLLGIGGGVLAVPAQQVFLKMPLKNAIGNSALAIAFSTLIGATLKNVTLGLHGFHIGQSLMIAVALIPASFIGGFLGAHLTHKLPRHPVRAVFVLMLMAAAWKVWHAKPLQPDGDTKAPAQPAATQPASPATP